MPAPGAGFDNSLRIQQTFSFRNCWKAGLQVGAPDSPEVSTFCKGPVVPEPSMSKNRVSFTLDSTLESVNTAEENAQRMAEKAGFDEEAQHQISMSVREAAVNAVLHGNAYDPHKKMRVSFEDTGKSLVIVISDEGEGLDENEVPDPLADENILKQSGRGIFLIKAFMDEVRIKKAHPGTEVTLVKYVRPASQGAMEERQ